METLSEGRNCGLMTVSLQTRSIAIAYGRWAPVYDLLFGPVFRHGRRVAVEAAERLGGRILEVGVGTGLSLPDYSPGSRLYGIDISQAMLVKARDRVDKLGLRNVEAIRVMDAECLDLPDASFDVVVFQYVLTAVPHPERALDEAMRVLKAGGELIITTRIGAESGVRGAVERALMPITGRLGWRTEFPFARYAAWARGSACAALIERRPLPPFDHFALLRFGKAAQAPVRPSPAGDRRTSRTTVPANGDQQ